jgi:hypothetical protein
MSLLGPGGARAQGSSISSALISWSSLSEVDRALPWCAPHWPPPPVNHSASSCVASLWPVRLWSRGKRWSSIGGSEDPAGSGVKGEGEGVDRQLLGPPVSRRLPRSARAAGRWVQPRGWAQGASEQAGASGTGGRSAALARGWVRSTWIGYRPRPPQSDRTLAESSYASETTNPRQLAVARQPLTRGFRFLGVEAVHRS